MKVKTKFLQEGGAVPAPAPAPEAGAAPAGGSPEEQVMAMADQIVQQLGPDTAAMLAQAIMQMLQGGGAGAGAGAPVFARKGGKLVKVEKQ